MMGMDDMTTEQMLLFIMREIKDHLEAGEDCGAIVFALASGAIERAEKASPWTGNAAIDAAIDLMTRDGEIIPEDDDDKSYRETTLQLLRGAVQHHENDLAAAMRRKVERGGSAIVGHPSTCGCYRCIVLRHPHLGETVEGRLQAGDPYTTKDDLALDEMTAAEFRADREADDKP